MVSSNTTHKLYTFVVYFPLHVLVVHVDHHQVEYRYRRKSVTRRGFFCINFPSLPVFHLMVDNMP